MSEFTMTDNEGDQLRIYHSGTLVDLCLEVNNEVVYVNQAETARLRGWLNGLYEHSNAVKPEPGPEEPDDASGRESAERQARTSDADKLRILADVIDAQAPFGTELADFKRRLQIVLGA